MVNSMVCPCCGGRIEFYNDSDGACDTCLTFVTEGELVLDPDYTEEEEET